MGESQAACPTWERSQRLFDQAQSQIWEVVAPVVAQWCTCFMEAAGDFLEEAYLCQRIHLIMKATYVHYSEIRKHI